MAAPLRQLAKQSFAGAKKQVRIHPLTSDEAVAVILTVMNASPAPLFRATAKSKQGRGLPRHEAFETIIRVVLEHKRGAIFAAAVTSIDADDVFHSDRFAVSLKRLGIMDDIASQLTSNGYGQVAELVKNKAPLFWAEIAARELDTVVKELGSTYTRVMHKFMESLNEEDLDELIEAKVMLHSISTLSPKLQFMQGVSNLNFGPNQSVYANMARRVSSNPNMVLLDKSSSIDGVFTSFHQHLLTDTNALQKLIPRTTFAGEKVTPQQFYKVFKDYQVSRRLHQAFIDAYSEEPHSVDINAFYRALKRNNFHKELNRAMKMYARLDLTEDAASAIISSVIGLFFAFAGDTKGQRFPFMVKR